MQTTDLWPFSIIPPWILQFLHYFSSCLQVLPPRLDVTSGSSFPLLVQPVAGMQSWCVGKEQIKEEEEEEVSGIGHTTSALSDQDASLKAHPCKIAFTHLKLLPFAGWILNKTFSKFTCVGSCHCAISPELFKLKCSPCGCGKGWTDGCAQVQLQKISKRLFMW